MGRLQRFAKCMREHGVQVEASTTEGRPDIRIDAGGAKPESPAFQAAQKACSTLLPGGGPGAGGKTPASPRSGAAGGG